jgi:type IV secretion system protein TrbL
MMKKVYLWLAAAALIFMCGTTFAAPLDLGLALTKYQTTSQQFGLTIADAAKKLAFLLFTIDLIWMVLNKLLKSADTPEILTSVVMRVMWFGFLLFLMNAQVLTDVINGFRKLGETGSGMSVFNPSDVFLQGIDMVNMMTTKFADGANIAGVPVPAGLAAAANPLVAFTFGMAIIVIVLAYLMMTAQYIAIMLQMYFYLACYPIVLAMGATKFGHDMSMKAISAAIVMGVRFLAIYFVMSIARSMSSLMGEQLADLSLANPSPMWAVLGMAGLLAFLAMKVPQMASDLLGGTASLSGGDAFAAGAVAVGAGAAVTGGAAALAGGVANGVAGAIKAGQAAMNQGGLAGAAKALGGGIAEAAGDKIKGLGSQSPGGSLASRINSQTASMQESAAAGAPAPSVPGGAQPPAPGGGIPAPGGGQPPAPGGGGAPAAAPGGAPDAGASSAPPQPTRDTPPAPTSAPGNSQPPAPSSPMSQAANTLVNELKQADKVQATAVNIQANSHE